MIAENAAKHNSFSDIEPLKLTVFSEGQDYLVIRNSLKVRKVSDSTGTGLKNINERYTLLSEKHLIVDQDDKFFTVKLPLIRIAS
jgi:LytS/YehU family sensor histidine kinase